MPSCLDYKKQGYGWSKLVPRKRRVTCEPSEQHEASQIFPLDYPPKARLLTSARADVLRYCRLSRQRYIMTGIAPCVVNLTSVILGTESLVHRGLEPNTKSLRTLFGQF